MTIDDIKKENRLLYHYISGSTLYHCNEEGSDIDTKGLYIASFNELFGLGCDKSFRDKWSGVLNLYQTQISDERNDNVLYEVGKYMGMLLSSNANVLESLFVPEDMMFTKPHKCLGGLFANRDKLITKACFKPFVEYAFKQIEKATGLNKKIVNPVEERLTPFDFAYTFYKQGSTKIKDWLDNRGLKSTKVVKFVSRLYSDVVFILFLIKFILSEKEATLPFLVVSLILSLKFFSERLKGETSIGIPNILLRIVFLFVALSKG